VALATGDFNADGILDIAAANRDEGTIALARGQGAGGIGDGTFAAPALRSTGPAPVRVEAADLNADGALDLIVVASNGVHVHLAILAGGVGSGSFQAGVRYLSSNISDIAVADFNTDGAPDIAAVSAIGGNVRLLMGNREGDGPDGTFTPGLQMAFVSTPTDIAAGDLSGDGIPDLVVASGSYATVLLNRRVAGFGSATFDYVPLVTSGTLVGVAIADVNRDGLADVVASQAVGTRVAVMAARDPGEFASDPFEEAEYYGPLANTPIRPTVTDLNGDSAPDVVVPSWGVRYFSVALGLCTAAPLVAPAIVDVSPRRGMVGDAVVVSGLRFGAQPAIAFGGVPAGPATPLPGGFRVTVPAGAVTGPVSVATPEGTDSTPYDFVVGRVPMIASFTPDSGGVGRQVTIVGVGFTGATRVSFGNAVSRSDFTVDSDDRIRALVDAASTSGPIELETPFGIAVSAVDFVRVSPDSGAGRPVVRDVPADNGGAVVVAWRRSDLDLSPSTYVTGYRVWRRAPVAAARSARLATAHAGEQALLESFWEPIATVPAAYLDGYAIVAPTTQDSIEAGNPWTAFFVQTLTSVPGILHNSPPDSGYSVDNLAPAEPALVVAEMGAGGGVDLRWSPAAEPDWVAFHVHRGGSEDFLPLPANRIAVVSSPAHHDAEGSGGHVYKVCSVDRHGNASAYATVSPPVAAPPAGDFALDRVSPNPWRGGPLAVRCTLAADEEVLLALFDVHGRRVSARRFAVPPPGSLALTLASGETLAPGVYLLRLQQGGRSAHARVVVLP